MRLDNPENQLTSGQVVMGAGLYMLNRMPLIWLEPLFVIVPPEHQNISCLPAEKLVPILMEY